MLILRKQFILRVFLFIGMIVSFLVTISLANRYFTVKKKFSTDIEHYARNLLDEVNNQINTETKTVVATAADLAHRLSSQELDHEKIESTLKDMLEKHSSLFGIGVAFSPEYTEANKLYAPYAVRQNQKIQIKHIENQYDYTKKNWYSKPQHKGPGWQETYFDQLTDSLITEYALPFYAPQDTLKKSPRGTVFVTVSLKSIKDLMTSFKLGKTGYAFIVAPQGSLIYHPVKEYVKSQYHLEDLLPHLRGFLKEATKIKNGIKKYRDPLTGLSSWLFFDQIPSTGWFLCITVAEKDILAGYPGLFYGMTIEYAKDFSKTLLAFLVPFVLFLCFLTMLLARVETADPRALWRASFMISFIFILALAAMWYIQIQTPAPLDGEQTKIIVDKTGLEQFLAHYKAQHKQELVPDQKIALGIYLNHVGLSQPDRVKLGGYLWQKNSTAIQTPNIFLAQSNFSKPLLPILTSKKDTTMLTTYAIDSLISQEFNYTMFPFDHKHVFVHFKIKDHENHFFIIPDLAAYNVLYPSSLPGLAPALNVFGWGIERTFFSFKEFSDIKNSKIASYIGEKDTPQLYYTMTLKRKFMDPFIAYVIPLIIALSILFVALLTTNSGGWNTISLVPTLFFAVILAHISLRNQLPGQPLFYLEYLYIIAYLSMFASIIILFLIINKSKARFITYKQALLPKIAYWPLILGLCFTITAVIFYHHMGG